MRIAFVGAYPGSSGRVEGGVAGAAAYLLDELRREPGVEVFVIVPKDRSGESVVERREGLTIHRLGVLPGWRLLPGTLYDIVAGRRQIRELLDQIEPDIVHYQGGAFLATDCRRPSVLTVHGIVERDAFLDRRWGPLWPLQWLLLRYTEGSARRRAPHVILISDHTGTFLPANSRRREWRINNAIDDSFFGVPRAPRPGRVLYVGRLRPLKNVVGLIVAFAETVRAIPGAELRLAGKGDEAYRRECERVAREHGVRDQVCFLGNLGVAEIQRELSQAACMVLPSLQENAPLAVEEAMAAGVPVVASRVGGIPEMVAHGESGLLVDPLSTKDIAAALTAVLGDAARAKSMGERGRRIAEERFRPSAVSRMTVRAYADILGWKSWGS